jgi:hypothetical protein
MEGHEEIRAIGSSQDTPEGVELMWSASGA